MSSQFECTKSDSKLYYRSWKSGVKDKESKSATRLITKLPSILILMIASWTSRDRILQSMTYISKYSPTHRIDWGIATWDHNNTREYQDVSIILFYYFITDIVI